MTLTRWSCECGKLHLEGEVQQPPLARLAGEDLQLAEELIICGGNLKTLAEHFEITYPTLRKRLDRVIQKLADERTRDRQHIDSILLQIEKGGIDPDDGIRRIKEIRNEL